MRRSTGTIIQTSFGTMADFRFRVKYLCLSLVSVFLECVFLLLDLEIDFEYLVTPGSE